MRSCDGCSRPVLFSRRSMLKLLSATIGSGSLSSLLASCGGDEGGGAGQKTNEVKMGDQLRFDPERLTITVGDSIEWKTIGAIPHTATCDEAKAKQPDQHVKRPAGAESWDSGIINQGQSFKHTFPMAGDYTYFCVPHELQGMVGYLTVKEASAGR